MQKKGFERGAGVLLNVSSLPGEYGVGTMGDGARRFIDFLAENKFKYWQILPLNPIGEGNSPYASASAFAGNMLYIDPALLCKQGYINRERLEKSKYTGSPYTADYAFAVKAHIAFLEEAYTAVDSKTLEMVYDFAAENEQIVEYAKYMALKEKNGLLPWYEWEEADKMPETAVIPKARVEYHLFVQYIFFTQWKELKTYANKKGILIIGDMPIYVSMDSSDVWANKDKGLFQFAPGYVPLKVAGVPPDYFSASGQLWGNPLYDWDKLAETDYAWWVERIGASLKLFDILRIDHFRGLASYWAVPYGAKSAAEGKWEKGPGMKLFEAVKKKYASLPLIAEDLGIFGSDVTKLLEDTGFPGMRVIQFGFDPNDNSIHLPHNYEKNTVAYTGTHDNNTLLGWLWEATPQQRAFALEYCSYKSDRWMDGGYRAPACRAILEAVWRSCSNIAIAPLQDICGFGSDARMNIPGIAKDNWRYRATEEIISSIDAEYVKKLNNTFKRG